MATRGYENFTATDVAQLQNKNAPAKPSKYRNVKTVADGQTFDSRREADYWLLLKSREQLGEIQNLRRQVRFELCCPTDMANLSAVVAYFVADYVYDIGKVQHVVDAKGLRTQIYKLKAKWMKLQHNVTVQEV